MAGSRVTWATLHHDPSTSQSWENWREIICCLYIFFGESSIYFFKVLISRLTFTLRIRSYGVPESLEIANEHWVRNQLWVWTNESWKTHPCSSLGFSTMVFLFITWKKCFLKGKAGKRGVKKRKGKEEKGGKKEWIKISEYEYILAT